MGEAKPNLAYITLGVGAICLGQPAAVFGAGPLTALEPGGYTSIFRILLILVAQLPWLAFCQWVD